MAKKLVKAVQLNFIFTFEYRDESEPDKKGYGRHWVKAITIDEALKAFYAEHGSKERLVITNIETEPTYTEKNFFH